MITNSKLYACIVTDNRYGSGVYVEMSEPPEEWRCKSYVQLRQFAYATGASLTNELVHVEEATAAWWDLTGVPLEECISVKGRR